MSANATLRLAKQLDKPTATLIVTGGAGNRLFIGEALLVAAALYLLARYCDKFLEGIGFDELAKSHGKKTREFIEQMHAQPIAQEAIPQFEIDHVLKVVQQNSQNLDAMAAAETAVEADVIAMGGLKMQGKKTATLVSLIVFSSE
jgi:hypothetical protein